MFVVIWNPADSSAFPGLWWIGISQNWCLYVILGHYKQYRINGWRRVFSVVFLHLFCGIKVKIKPNCYWTSVFFGNLQDLWLCLHLCETQIRFGVFWNCVEILIVSNIIKQNIASRFGTPFLDSVTCCKSWKWAVVWSKRIKRFNSSGTGDGEHPPSLQRWCIASHVVSPMNFSWRSAFYSRFFALASISVDS